jgi:hypothetical protein
MTHPDDFRATRLRPYALTGGRTRGAVDLAIETMVRTIADDARLEAGPGRERARIVRLCRQPLSVAEVSAHLGLHLQAVRVLLGDLVAEGLLETTSPPATGDRPDLRLLERVLDGLQSL